MSEDEKEKIASVCEWELIDEDYNVYSTECDNLFNLEIGTPSDNNINYCCFCGKKIEVSHIQQSKKGNTK